MIRTHYFKCQLLKAQANALNAESGRIYTQVMVEHYRVYRKHGIWLKQPQAQKLNDLTNSNTPRLLHAHSIDAAQQGFYKACKTSKTNRAKGAKYPHQRKRYRASIWKNTGIRVEHGVMQLALARGLEKIEVPLPSNLQAYPAEYFQEVRLVYNRSSRHYEWHVVLDDQQPQSEPSGQYVAGIDLGEIHPAVLTDGQSATVISCRELRALNQYTNKRLAALSATQAKYKKYSSRWWRIQRRRNRLLAQRKRDMEHKISHEVVSWALEHEIGEIAIGDVRDIANGKRLNTKSQQKISNWSHGKIRQYITYKARAEGIRIVDNISERYTSQTCPHCGHRTKPKGRVYSCSACGSVFHRDVVGAANILSRHVYGELAKVAAVPPKYRHPVMVQGKRSPSDTGQVARRRSNENWCERSESSSSCAVPSVAECHKNCILGFTTL